MKKSNILGSVAAFIEAAAYVHGIIFFAVIMKYNEAFSNSDKLALLIENQSMMLTAYFVIYLLFGIALVFLSVSLYKALKRNGSELATTVYSFGIIWSTVVIATGMINNISIGYLVKLFEINPGQAETVFATLRLITEGLGGGNEIVGGIFTLLVSLANHKVKIFSTTVTYNGFLVGIAGIVSTFPQAAEIATSVFGLGQIFWFVFVGIGFLKLDK